MAARPRPIPTFNTSRIVSDMAARGIDIMRLAALAGLSHMTVRRFLDGSSQTIKTAAKLAAALGYSPRRYLLGTSMKETAA